MEIRTKREYLELVPPLGKVEFDELKRSIKERKQMVPVIVNTKNEILDGHHRWKACKELGKTVDFYIAKHLTNELDEKEFIIEVNLKRRQLNEFQRGEMGLALEKIEAERAKLRHNATKFTPTKAKEAINKRWNKPIAPASHETDAKPKPSTRTSQVVADRVNVSHATLERVKKIKEKASNEQIRQLTEGSIGIRKVFSQIKREEKRDELISQARDRLRIESQVQLAQPIVKNQIMESLKIPIHIFNKDFRQITQSEIPPNSIDLIFTDPPYTQESLPLYGALAQAATIWLKEGGSLVTYAPTYALPQVLNLMQRPMLHYWWQFVVKHTGGRTRMHKYRLWVRYKPLLWFVKGPSDSPPANMIDDVDDFIVSKPPEDGKAMHDWEQSTVEASYIIQNLSVEGQAVLDPFMGTGTTGLAAIRLKRQFFGSELNDVHYTTAADRLNREKRPI